MNTQQAKRIPLQDVLSRLGYQPAKQARGELWYCSPFRAETVPSFKINPERNIWYDFGEGAGGNVLDFVMKHEKVSTIPDALDALERIYGRPSLFDVDALPRPRSPQQLITPKSPEEPRAPEVTVKVIHHRALLTYLAGRGISAELARPFVQEIHYTRDGKAYFALAFKNESGGYELRNPWFKGTHGPKDLTLIPGQENPRAHIAVFEGFIDFLSALAGGALPHPRPTVLVMNSNALKEKALGAIRRQEPQTVELFLDHDPSGRELTAYFREELAGVDVIDRSNLYAGHKDLNEYLTASTRSRVLRS